MQWNGLTVIRYSLTVIHNVSVTLIALPAHITNNK
jgi:hypothetical protein